MSQSASNFLKTPMVLGAQKVASKKIGEAQQQFGKALPCVVTAVDGAVVTVSFQVETDFTLPSVKIPVIGAEYIRLPIRVGCKGVTIPADARLGGVSGLGGSAPRLDAPANMTALMFVPIGNAMWSDYDPETLVIYSAEAVRIEVSPSAIRLVGPVNIMGQVTVTGGLSTTGVLKAGNGVSGSVTAGGHTLTFTDGILTGYI